MKTSSRVLTRAWHVSLLALLPMPTVAADGALPATFAWYWLLAAALLGAATSWALRRCRRPAARSGGSDAEIARLREQLQQSQQASTAMLHTLDRETRTALSSIIGFAQLIEHAPGPDFNAARHAHKIYLVGHDLIGLFDSLRGLTRRDEPPAADAALDADFGTLAALLATCPTAEPEYLPRARSAGTGVLVVEDDAFNQEVIREQVALIGLPVATVASGEEALVRWREFAVVLTDINMPGIDGYELARRIRAAEAGGANRVAIVALTANAAGDELQRCRDAGMDDCIVKPVDFMTLKTKLAEWS